MSKFKLDGSFEDFKRAVREAAEESQTPHKIKLDTDKIPIRGNIFTPTCSCGWVGKPSAVGKVALTEGTIHTTLANKAERKAGS